MKGVELYARVRYAVRIEGISRREAARRFGIDPRTVAKMLSFSVPPGYRRSRPPARPKLDPLVGIIDAILEEDKARPAKQRHTSKRIFERLRDEHGYGGGSLRARSMAAPPKTASGMALGLLLEIRRHPGGAEWQPHPGSLHTEF